jgi:hypothetical protein
MIATCRCDKRVPGFPIEPCARPLTQEDLLCDVCRCGCGSVVAVGPAGGRPDRLLAAHAEIETFIAPETGTYNFRFG